MGKDATKDGSNDMINACSEDVRKEYDGKIRVADEE